MAKKPVSVPSKKNPLKGKKGPKVKPMKGGKGPKAKQEGNKSM